MLSIVTLSSALLVGAGSGVASSEPKVGTAAGPVTVVPDTNPSDWGRYTHDDSGSGFASSESKISAGNAATLAEKWRRPAADAHDKIFSQVTVANGLVFFNDNSGREYAFDLNGNLKWTQAGLGETFGPPNPGPGAYTQGPASSAEFATISNGSIGGAINVLYVAGGVGDIFALNADTGAILWKTNITNPVQGGFTWTSPLIVNNTVYVGIASEADVPLNPGAFVKMNALTGGSVVTVTMTPAGGVIPAGTAPSPHLPNYPGSPVGLPCVGGGIWGSPTYDPNFGAGGTIFVATGTFDQHCSITPTLEEAIVAFDPATLAVRDHWQIPTPLGSPDSDFGSVPTLFDAPIAGTSGHMLGIANKNGNFYALDRQNLAAGPKWNVPVGLAGGDPENAGTGPIAPAAYDGKLIYDAAGVLTVGGVTCKSAITAMVPTTGAVAWQHCFSAGDDGVVIGPVTAANGVVFVGEGRWIRGVSAATGTLLFSFSAGVGPVHTGPTVANGVLYFGDSTPLTGGAGEMVALVPSNRPRFSLPGYWLVATDGGIFSFGDAQFFGSTGSIHLNKPIVGMASTPSGNGYWLVASDGGIFSFGDAQFFGSTGAIHLNKPIVGMAASPSGAGYWLVATDGGIFNYGDAAFLGSTGAIHLNQPVVGMAASPSGAGYWLVATDGGIFNYGDAAFYGSTGSIRLNKPIVGMA